MIESIHLRNFQGHGDFLIELDPHVTTIVGPSDTGKSAVIRAIKWVVFNRPSGDAFLKHGKKFVRASLRVDGQEIRRSKGRRNLYAIDPQEYLAFGQGVPDEVQSLLNVNEVNFQSQHDPVFWFSLSPSEVSKELNTVVNLGLIDKSFSAISLEKHRTKEKVKFVEERISGFKLKEMSLRWVVSAEVDMRRIERLSQSHLDILGKCEGLRSTLSDAHIRGEMLQSLREAYNEGEKVVELAGRKIACDEKASLLRTLVDAFRTHERSKGDNVPANALDSLEAILGIYRDKYARSVSLEGLIRDYREWEDAKCQSEKSCIQKERELTKLTKGQECPICQKPFTR